MIDTVQRSLERMASELESYRKRKIFDEKQLKKVLETRKSFENKLARKNRKLIDFLEYIDSEKRLERIRNKKIMDMGIQIEEADLALTENIIKTYEKALYYFDEPSIVRDFSEYCIKKKRFEEMKTAFSKKCLKNTSDADLWIFCAQKLWEIDDINGARELFIKAISVNTDKRLYVEFFRFECLYVLKLNKINDELGVLEEDKDDVERGQLALVIFEEMRDKLSQTQIEECIEIARLVPEIEKGIVKILGQFEQ